MTLYVVSFRTRREKGKEEIEISEMHNIVEGALERVNPKVAKSYRDYRNYKQDFVQMLDEVYKKSQSIMCIDDKENSNTEQLLLVSTKRSLIFNQLNKMNFTRSFSLQQKNFRRVVTDIFTYTICRQDVIQ